MGIGASTNVKEIRIDQKDAKWESYPSSASSRRGSRGRSLANLGKRWINSAETAANSRRLQQLNTALEAAEKRAQDGEQRVRQLERELATLELRNMELADESTWLRKQLSDRPEVPISQRPPTGTLKNAAGGATAMVGGAAASAAADPSDAYRVKQTQYVSKLESQIRLYEEDILKLKTKMSKETQRLQAELEDQKHRSDKEVRSLDNRLIEAHKLNQKYEEVIGNKISSETVTQLRNEVQVECGGAASASAVRTAASASMTCGGGGGGDTLNQSKSRAQLILELTEQISVQQDKIRYLEEEIEQRDIDLSRLRTMVQKSDDSGGVGVRKSSRSSGAASAGRIQNMSVKVKTPSTSSSRRTVQSEPAFGSSTPVVANEDEIEALLNNPAMYYEPDESDEEIEIRKRDKTENDDRDQERSPMPPMNLSVSQDLQQQQQMMSASLRSVPTSWRKDPSAAAPGTASVSGGGAAAGLPPSGASSKRIISIVNTVDGNNLGGAIGPTSEQTSRPKTMAGGRPRISPSPKRQQTVDEVSSTGRDESPHPVKPARQVSADTSANQNVGGSRTHSAPMFSFKPRPSSKQSQRSSLTTAASITGGELPLPIDLEEQSGLEAEPRQARKKQASSREARKPPTSSQRKNSDSIEVLSLHDQETNYGASAAAYEDSSNAEGDIEDGDDEEPIREDDYNSDQEIRRRFEERWKKSTTASAEIVDESEPDRLIVRSKMPRPPAGGGVGQAAPTANASASAADKKERDRVSTSAKSQDSGFLGDSASSTNSLSLWKGRNKRQMSSQQPAYDPLDVDKLLEM